MKRSAAKKTLVILTYPLFIIVLTWPWIIHFDESYLGYQNVDAFDTIALRGLIGRWALGENGGLFWPTGYPFWKLTPNLLDHLSALPFISIFQFPLGDNVWWLLILSANGWAAHHLGETIAPKCGYACGITWLLSESLLREANLHHGPQAMVFWAPLAMAALLRLHRQPSYRKAVWVGICMGGLSLSYWYAAMFLMLGALPWLFRIRFKMNVIWCLVSLLLTFPALIPLLTSSPEMLRIPSPDSIPSGVEWVKRLNNTPLFFLKSSPADVSNRIAMTAIVAAIVGWRQNGDRWNWAFMGLLGAVMLQGTHWSWQNGSISLPFEWFGELHPFIDRLHWPQRWGVIVSLAVAALACKAPKAWLWLPVLFLETLLISHNAPLDVSLVQSKSCMRDLSSADGAMIEFPIETRQSNLAGLHQRLHRKELFNPMNLPPGHKPPTEWLNEKVLQTLVRKIEKGIAVSDAATQLQQRGIGAVYVPTTPPNAHPQIIIQKQIERIRINLGEEINLDCAAVWWFSAASPPKRVNRNIPKGDPAPRPPNTVIEAH